MKREELSLFKEIVAAIVQKPDGCLGHNQALIVGNRGRAGEQEKFIDRLVAEGWLEFRWRILASIRFRSRNCHTSSFRFLRYFHQYNVVLMNWILSSCVSRATTGTGASAVISFQRHLDVIQIWSLLDQNHKRENGISPPENNRMRAWAARHRREGKRKDVTLGPRALVDLRPYVEAAHGDEMCCEWAQVICFDHHAAAAAAAAAAPARAAAGSRAEARRVRARGDC